MDFLGRAFGFSLDYSIKIIACGSMVLGMFKICLTVSLQNIGAENQHVPKPFSLAESKHVLYCGT